MSQSRISYQLQDTAEIEVDDYIWRLTSKFRWFEHSRRNCHDDKMLKSYFLGKHLYTIYLKLWGSGVTCFCPRKGSSQTTNEPETPLLPRCLCDGIFTNFTLCSSDWYARTIQVLQILPYLNVIKTIVSSVREFGRGCFLRPWTPKALIDMHL